MVFIRTAKPGLSKAACTSFQREVGWRHFLGIPKIPAPPSRVERKEAHKSLTPEHSETPSSQQAEVYKVKKLICKSLALKVSCPT